MNHLDRNTNEENNWNQVAEIEIIYKSKVKPSLRPVIKTSKDAADLIRKHFNQDTLEIQEQFYVLYLNCANKALGIIKHSIGGMTSTVADPRLILGTALKIGATAILLTHSHPSGNVKPSRYDEALTQKIKHGAGFMDIKVIDHIIIAAENYYSMADEGMI